MKAALAAPSWWVVKIQPKTIGARASPKDWLARRRG